MTVRLFYVNMGAAPGQGQALSGFNDSWAILASGIIQVGTNFYLWAIYDDHIRL